MTRLDEPDSHRFDARNYERWAGFTGAVDSEVEVCPCCAHEIDENGRCGCNHCAETGCSRPSEPGCECCRFHEWAEAMRVGDMELAAQWFGEMTDVEQREAQGEYAAARSALDKMAAEGEEA